MADQTARIAAFRSLHEAGTFVIPNPWDAGSARILQSLGFVALATTSSGFAATLGRKDYGITRAESLAHCEALVEATDLPVSADLEHGFAEDPAGVAETVGLALDTGLAGCSIEDSTGRADDPLFDAHLAAERVAAAVEAAGTGDRRLVITARAEGFLWGRPDLADAIARLQAYRAAGADCLYAPGLRSIDDIRTLVAEVNGPVNVLAVSGGPTVPELAEVGVRRVSVGGGLAWAAYGALVEGARELLDQGTYGWMEADAKNRPTVVGALS